MIKRRLQLMLMLSLTSKCSILNIALAFLLSVTVSLHLQLVANADSYDQSTAYAQASSVSDPEIITKLDRLPPTFQTVIQKSQSSGGETNRTLVIATGSLRGGEAAWQSMARHVLDVNSADLALVVSSESPRNVSLIQRSKYTLLVPEYQDWAEAMDLIPQRNPDWRRIHLGEHSSWLNRNNSRVAKGNILLGAASDMPGSGALVFMYRFFASHLIQSQGLHHKYSRFIITRTDHYYPCPHNIQHLDENFLWVPTGEDYGGVCDRHLVVGSRHVLKALHVLPPLVQAPYAYRHLFREVNYNTEQFLLLRWKKQGLPYRRFNRSMFLVQAPGDPTRWRDAQEEAPEFGAGIMAKYPDELYEARKTCRPYLLQNPPPGGPLPTLARQKKLRWKQLLFWLSD